MFNTANTDKLKTKLIHQFEENTNKMFGSNVNTILCILAKTWTFWTETFVQSFTISQLHLLSSASFFYVKWL